MYLASVVVSGITALEVDGAGADAEGIRLFAGVFGAAIDAGLRSPVRVLARGGPSEVPGSVEAGRDGVMGRLPAPEARSDLLTADTGREMEVPKELAGLARAGAGSAGARLTAGDNGRLLGGEEGPALGALDGAEAAEPFKPSIIGKMVVREAGFRDDALSATRS